MALNPSEILPPDCEGEARDENFNNVKHDHEPEANLREPVAINQVLLRLTLAVRVDLHAEVDACDKNKYDALAPVHRSIGHEIYPDCDRVHPACSDIEDHHGHDAHDDFAYHDALDPLAALARQACIENNCVRGLRAAHHAAHFHHLADIVFVMNKIQLIIFNRPINQ